MTDRDRMIAELTEALKHANELLRSTSAICDRQGRDTNWEAFSRQVRTVLAEQHYFLHPEQYVGGPRAG